MAVAEMQQGVAWRGRRLRPAQVLALVLAIFAACYAGGPFLTLWRITRALDSGNLAVLQGTIDWQDVRQGLKEDIADGLIGVPQKTLVASNTLPPFGSGFATGIVATEINGAVTPENLGRAAHTLGPPAGRAFGLPDIVGAGFASPTEFDLRVRLPCQERGDPPLHLRMAFRGLRWQVVRVWVPQELMDVAAAAS